MIHRLRLSSGLVMFAFVLSHFANHGLGLVSLDWMNGGLVVFTALWWSLPGTVVLYAAFAVHLGIALWSVFARRSLRMPAWEAAQLGLGLAIPVLLIDHVGGTRLAAEFGHVRVDYTYVQYVYWVLAPDRGVWQAVALLVAWSHGCIGVHYWLRTKDWYARWRTIAFAAALVVPTLALSGYVSSGVEVRALAAEDDWVERMAENANVPVEALVGLPFGATFQVWIVVAVIAAAFAARFARRRLWQARRGPRLTYPGGVVVDVSPGASVLEISRMNGIPHAAVCGGRGRCSTCRVRLGAGAEYLAPPAAEEVRVLTRVGAPPSVRLACQIRPTRSLEVTPLLPANASAREAFRRPGYLAGQEREIAILFADIRGFTRLSGGMLPFDLVFLLNRYFETMGRAVETAEGRLDKFIGDGVMALFGIERGPTVGARRALEAARQMASGVEALNRDMDSELQQPLRIGIGIHVGPAIVGEMGWGHAKSLTAVGDAVNVASRMEGLTKEYSAQLVVSADVVDRAGLDLAMFAEHHAEVRGKTRPMRVLVLKSALDLPPA